MILKMKVGGADINEATLALVVASNRTNDKV